MKILDRIEKLNQEQEENKANIEKELENVIMQLNEAKEQENELNTSLIKKFDLKLKAKKLALSKTIESLVSEKEQIEQILKASSNKTIEVDINEASKEITEYINNKYKFEDKVIAVKEAKDNYIKLINELSELADEIAMEINGIKSDLTDNTNLGYDSRLYSTDSNFVDLRYYSKRDFDNSLRLIDRVSLIARYW